ncbi:hypothetical protein Afil01_18380 [Actinorhabdospora filicis]|uniref:WD40 repeat protein n=1 Tax=Actinorhabdospora filicis TaxID=1785913 RepID=A0A9W6W912_9ACTN|nr:hypothetical protein [Actinorhabdospora filicis]GLZ77031.1 hypothetical protein Afil01_18380 [Actinorhabdospora filicis]
MSADRLRGILRDMADEAHPAPLVAGAVRRTRRARARQAAVAVIAVLGVLAGLIAVLGPGTDARPEPAISPSPSPSPSASAYTGAFYYLKPDGSVWRWRVAGVPEKILDGGGYHRATASVSPDGKYLAYVDDDMMLTVVPTRGGTPRKLLAYSPNLTCVEPVWAPDSRSLLVSPREMEGLWLVDVEDPGNPYPIGYEVDGCHPQFRYQSGLDLIWVTTDGERIRGSGGENYTAIMPRMRVTGLAVLIPDTLIQFCATTSKDPLTTVPPRPLSCTVMMETALGDQIRMFPDPPTDNGIMDVIPRGPKNAQGQTCVAFRELTQNGVAIMCHAGYFGNGVSERVNEPVDLIEADLLVYVP